MGLQNRLAEQEANISNLKQTLLRVTLAKQSLESEKKELTRRVEEITEEIERECGETVPSLGHSLPHLRAAILGVSNKSYYKQ